MKIWDERPDEFLRFLGERLLDNQSLGQISEEMNEHFELTGEAKVSWSAINFRFRNLDSRERLTSMFGAQSLTMMDRFITKRREADRDFLEALPLADNEYQFGTDPRKNLTCSWVIETAEGEDGPCYCNKRRSRGPYCFEHATRAYAPPDNKAAIR